VFGNANRQQIKILTIDDESQQRSALSDAIPGFLRSTKFPPSAAPAQAVLQPNQWQQGQRAEARAQ
jgi:hypothetical protein